MYPDNPKRLYKWFTLDSQDSTKEKKQGQF